MVVFSRNVLSIPSGKVLDKILNFCISGKPVANVLTFT